MAFKTHPQHFYSFSFIKFEGDLQTVANSYVGLAEQKVTKAVIDFARDTARIESNAVLTAVCYLGYLSEAEFHAPL